MGLNMYKQNRARLSLILETMRYLETGHKIHHYPFIIPEWNNTPTAVPVEPWNQYSSMECHGTGYRVDSWDCEENLLDLLN
jgi:hypothetical protein